MSDKSQADTDRKDIEDVLGVGEKGRSGLFGRAKWLLLLVLVLAAGGAAYYLFGSGNSTSNVQYRTDEARVGDITVIVTATGTVEPTNKVDTSFLS